MRIDVTHRGSYALAKVALGPGEQVKAEAGALVAFRGDVDVQTSTGGLVKGLKRAVMGGESLFQNTFTGGTGGGEVHLAPALPGDLVHETLDGGGLIVQDASYLASAPGIEVDTRFQGLKGFFAGEGFVMLHVSGTGDLLLSSYGGIERHDLAEGDRFSVDTGHLVAFTDGMRYETRRLGGLKSAVLGGEGLVSAFEGPGTVWTQTRSTQGFVDWLMRRLPGGRQGGGGRGIADIFGG